MSRYLRKVKEYLQEFTPKSVICFKEGYSTSLFLNDLFAGVTVGIIALPLAMAFAIGSGVPPERGLFTAIIAGFLISFLGGSRVQIGGPTGAFVVIVYGIIQKFGYDGLAVATLIGGVLIILMGLTRCGVLLRFIPYPVITGFTTGIAVSIFSSQIKDFFGLRIEKLPVEFIEKWTAYTSNIHTCSLCSVVLAGSTLALIFILRRFFPRFPGVILAVVLATIVAYIFNLPLETIQSKFGGIPNMLPAPSWPSFTFETVQQVFPSAITIALLGGIESLLSAMVADGMSGHRHRSNIELVAQGLANIGSVLFGGIPATGAIARTTANIKMGAKTPMAGMIHAVTLLMLMLFLSSLAAMVPLAALSAVLIFVAWNMSELPHFIEILRSDISDAIVLVFTFLVTVLIDLTAGVQIGVILSAVLFLKKMTDSTTVQACRILMMEESKALEDPDSDILLREDVPSDVIVFEMKGPFFFAVADLLNEVLRRLPEKPRVFILRMRQVPMMDTTGLKALKQFNLKCKEQGILFLVSGAQPAVLSLFRAAKLDEAIGKGHLFPHVDAALACARNQCLPGPKSAITSTT